MATEIKLCSVDFSFAPVLDVDRDTSSVIGDRSFSDDPELVSIAAKAFIEGIHDAGLPCVVNISRVMEVLRLIVISITHQILEQLTRFNLMI